MIGRIKNLLKIILGVVGLGLFFILLTQVMSAIFIFYLFWFIKPLFVSLIFAALVYLLISPYQDEKLSRYKNFFRLPTLILLGLILTGIAIFFVEDIVHRNSLNRLAYDVVMLLLYLLLFLVLLAYVRNKFILVQQVVLRFQTFAQGVISYVLLWITQFKQATLKQRWVMVRKPLIALVIILLLVNFGPLFFPPKLMTTFPGNQSAEAPLDSRVEVIFSRGMFRPSVEGSFRITPAIAGDLSWESNQKLVFTPKTKLERGKSYSISFQGIPLSSFFIPLIGNTTITFETIGNPKVILASPQDEALEDLTPVTVVFDRPMIALTTATNSAIKKPAFGITPQIKGEGRWLGTTAYQFRPSEAFKRATTYKVTVPAGMHSQDEGILQSDYSWEFSSERPRIEKVTPERGYDYASPIASVSAQFNQEIDPKSIADKFILLDSNKNTIPGRIVVTGKVAGFYPAKPLTREQHYDVTIKAGVNSVEGPNGMEADYPWSFVVAAKPEIVSSTPANGDKESAEQYRVEVLFKTPMDEKSFEGNIAIDPQPETKPSLGFSSYNNRHALSINTYLGRSTAYTITISPGVKDQYGVSLGNPYTIKFTTASYKPSISMHPFGTYFGAFNQQIIPRVVAQTINANRVDYTLYKLKAEDLLDLYRRRYEQQCSTYDDLCRNWQNYDTSKLEKVRSWNESYEADFNTPVQVVTKVTTSSGGNIPAGFYFLDMKIPQGAHDNMVMIVSKSALTVKKSSKQIFSWAVDQSSSNVVPGMTVWLTDSSGTKLAEGNTNNDGVFMKDVDLFQKDNLFVFGQKGDDIVVAASAWSEGINRSDFGLPSYYNPNEQKDYNVKQDYKLFVTLDRPIYRPGQKVYFKGVIRKDNDGAYENLKPGEKVTVTMSDARNRSVYSKDLPITTFGSFAGDFILSKDADLGFYQTSVNFSGTTFTQSFQVEEYRRPEVSVQVKPSKNAYIQGEDGEISVNASYYFGAPLTSAPVSWTLESWDYSFQWDKDWRFEFGDPDSYWSRPWWGYSSSYSAGKKVTDGKGVTDAKGDLVVKMPLDISKQKTSQTMTVEATVNDINNQAIAASQEFTVHKGGLYVGLHPASYANESGKEARVEIVTVDVKGKEVPNTPVSIEFYKRTWETVREKNPDDGLFYYVSKPSDALVSTSTATTDSLGRAVASFTPTEGGTFKVVGKVTDKDGNQNKSGSFLWVSGFGFSAPRENNDRIVLVTDKRDYLVGEKLSVFVASPIASASAKTLLTAERGSVLDYKIVDTSETSNNFSMPIPSKYTPNVFIGAVLVKGGDQVKNPPEFKIGYTEVKVTDKKQQVNVSLSTDKKRYKPKDTLKATIETKNLLGQPVSTELAVGLVDKAVWDLGQVQMPDIYKTFYQPRNLEVSTAQLLTISIDRINANTNLGAKGGSGGGGGGGGPDTSRRDFPETAYWNPNLTTDNNGKATVEIKLPDNLTTWRLAAIANSQEAAFGSSVSEVIVSRDVLIRPFLPRFLSVGDEADLGAILVNTSGEDQTLIAKIEGEGIQIQGEKTKTITLADGAQAKLTWPTLTQDVLSAKVKLAVEGSDKVVKDSVETSLPVKSYSVPEVVATSGEAKDTAEEKIVLPKEVDFTQGQASIDLSPSLGSASINSLPYLFSYPYYCTEQITSKFLPAVFVNRILNNAKIDKSGSLDTKQLADVINDGIQRLNKEQHPDGGWGWWTEYDSNPFLTAYAFLGLTEAKKDRYTVADQTLQRAQSFLVGQLAQGEKVVSLNIQAFILYVLRGSKVNVSSYAANLFDRRFELSLEARAYLAMAMKDAGMGNAKRLHDELISLAKKTATTTHWEEPKRDYYFMGSNTTTTASVLEALIQFDKKNPLIPEVIRHLMSIRTDNHWSSTRDSAAVIKAISSQLLGRGDQKVNEDFRLELNGKILQQGKLSKEDLLSLKTYAISVSDLQAGAENKLRVTKSGEGNLYYNVNLKYYLPFSEIKPLEQGMVVVREFVDSKGKILPIDSIDENTEVWVRLIVVAPEERHFVVIEDVLPAGLESVNESLKNVSVLNKDRPNLKEKGNQLLYFEHKEYHDDRTTLFANYLPPGVYEVAYRVRATTPGRYHHPPAQAYQMYIPDVSGHSDGGWLEIKSISP